MSNPEPGKKPEKSPAIAAAVILLVAGAAIYLLPTVVLTLAVVSPYLAAFAGACIILAFFLVFWLRARYQRRHGG